MSDDDVRPISGTRRQLWEALFSLHLGLLGMSVVLTASTAVSAPFMRMEIRINRFLHIRQTDFIRGDFETWIPSVLVALLIWVLLRTFSRTRVTEEFLRSLAGILTILGPLAFWVFFYEKMSWPLGSLFKGDALEIFTVLLCARLFLNGEWKIPYWAAFIFLCAHYAFWYFTAGSNPGFSNYGGPLGPLLGFCAAAAWVLHVNHLRKVKAVGTPLVT